MVVHGVRVGRVSLGVIGRVCRDGNCEIVGCLLDWGMKPSEKIGEEKMVLLVSKTALIFWYL